MSEKFKEFIGNCWKDHDKKTDEVSKNLRSNLNLIESEDQIPPYVGLITHTFGGHLGKWSEGLEVLGLMEGATSFVKIQYCGG